MHKACSRFAGVAMIAALAGCAHQGGYGPTRLAAQMQQQQDEDSQTPPNDRHMYLQLIEQMQQRGLYYASLAHIDAYTKRYGASSRLRLLHADALRETDRAAAAAALYRTLLDTGQAAAAHHGLGLIEIRQGQSAAALTDLAKAVALQPLNTTYLGDLGYARLRSGDMSGARQPLATAAELAPDNTKAISNLALLLAVEGHADKAATMMQQAQLPAATRQAVQRMAQGIRQSLRHDAAVPHTPPRPNTDIAGTALTPHASGAGPTRIAGIPQSMLDRFGSAHQTSGETHERP